MPLRGREATASAIEKATLDMMLKHGYDNVTVDMICGEVGISQRTFFNYFPTKDDAVLGRDMPQIDQQASRRFVLSDDSLLLDALSLIHWPATSPGPRPIDERIRVISHSPALIGKQTERFGALEAELKEIIGLRLEHQRPESTEEDRAAEAAMVTQLLGGAMRFMGMSAKDGGLSMEEIMQRTHATLERVLTDSSAPKTDEAN